jgi:hypothetical protein
MIAGCRKIAMPPEICSQTRNGFRRELRRLPEQYMGLV